MDQAQKNDTIAQFLGVTGAKPAEVRLVWLTTVNHSPPHYNNTLTTPRRRPISQTPTGTSATPSPSTLPPKKAAPNPTTTPKWTTPEQTQTTPAHAPSTAAQHQSPRPEQLAHPETQEHPPRRVANHHAAALRLWEISEQVVRTQVMDMMRIVMRMMSSRGICMLGVRSQGSSSRTRANQAMMRGSW